MKVEIYSGEHGKTIEEVNLPVADVEAYLNLLKSNGYEDTEGNEYKYNDSKVCNGGFVVYVDLM